MAYIEKLLIRGIRSFGPAEEDEAQLKFTTPLTIILGQNGCGKTTVIEALKYGTCGETPGLGSGFVHDPKLNNSSEVKAQVKLQVRDIRGKPVFVSRCMQSVQKAKTVSFKTLDQTITRRNQAGQDVSISGRCVDINAEMCHALGVSKHILDYVIFCHQEDSNWPLEEGSKLKNKFDSIFDTAKYNKCLDTIKKNKKDLSDDLKEKQHDLKLLKDKMSEAADKRAKLKEEEGRMNVIQDKVTEYENELRPIKRKLEELITRESDISTLITDREKRSATLKQIQNSIREYRQAISTEFQGTTEELKQAILDFKAQSSQLESRRQALEGERNGVQSEEQELTSLVATEQVKLGQLGRDFEQNTDRIEQRNRALECLCDQLSLESKVLTEGDVVRSLGSAERSIKEAESALEHLREKGDQEDKTLQEKIDNLREEKTKLEQTLHLKNQLLVANKQETGALKREIEEVNQSTEKLSRLTTQLSKVQDAMEELAKAVDLAQLESEIKDSETRRDKLEDDLTRLDQEVRELQSMSQHMTEMKMLKESKNTKEAEVRKLRNKTEDSLKHLLGNIPDVGIKHELQSCVENLAHTIRTMQAKISDQQKQLTTLEADHKHLKEKHREKMCTLSQDQDELENVCGSRDFETVLADVTKQLDNAQDEKGTLKASEFMFRRYVDKLTTEKPCCPLCHRDFQEAQESQDLIIELEGRMRGLPRLIENKERELEELQERQAQLQQLKPTFERISQVKTKEIPALSSQVAVSETKLRTLREQLSSFSNDLTMPQADESMAKSIQGDVALLDQHLNELRKLDREIAKLQERLPQGGSKRSLQDALTEQDTIRKEIQSSRKILQSSQEKRNRYNQQLHNLQTEKNKIVEQQLKIQGGVQKKKQLEEKMEELQVKEITLSEEYDQIREEIQPMNESLEAAIEEKERTRLAHKRVLDQERDKVNNLNRQCDEVRKLQEALDKYKRSGAAEKLTATKQTISRLNVEKELLNEKKQHLLDQLDEVKAQQTNQQVHTRELDDNLKLRQKREEEEKITQKIAELSDKIGGLDLRGVLQEKDSLKKREEFISKDKARTEGRKGELQDNIQSLRLELNMDKYKTVDKKYSDCLIEVKVTDAAIGDLGHYSKALDWAVSHFHNERMKHINDIIGDLWTQIYCGNDIDTIKIKIDEEITQGEKRKSYNYRVVQVKSGQELDMRGRCSAGQKMLASLIIRLALAEIFSTKCGILTLDEPTTNLDRDNIDRLCSALASLITVRANHKSNFQLIVITHDEEFIDKLTKMHKVDYYFSVSRNQKGKSTVSKVCCG